jgi:hypothetical protein
VDDGVKLWFHLFCVLPKKTQKRSKMTSKQRIEQALQRFDARVTFNGVKDKKAIAGAEYGKYCKWVEENNLRLPAAIDKYLHRDAVNQYFAQVVVGRNGNTNTLGQIRSSLQWCWDPVESLPEDGPFVIKNAVVDRAIRDQQVSWKIREHTIHAGWK